MPLRSDIKKVLVIGSGPIVIGQAAEFDYAGTQACRALKQEGLEVVLVNSNPATIMTDKAMADKVYIEPLTLGEISEKLGVKGMDRASEDYITAREMILASSVDARIHICHVSTEGSATMIRFAKSIGVKVTCETAPHYFMLTDKLLEKRDADYRMNPPLRTPKDVMAIIEAIKDGTIDCIITDHAPHASEEKADFEKAPNGVVGLETSLAATLTALYHTGEIKLNRVVELMCINPRKILGLDIPTMKVGSTADLIIVDTGQSLQLF